MVKESSGHSSLLNVMFMKFSLLWHIAQYKFFSKGMCLCCYFICLTGTPILALSYSADFKSRNGITRLCHMDNAIISSPALTRQTSVLDCVRCISTQLLWLACATCKGQRVNHATCQKLKTVGRVLSWVDCDLIIERKTYSRAQMVTF